MPNENNEQNRIYGTHFKGAITFLLDDIEQIFGAAYNELKTILDHISEEIRKCEGELHLDIPEKIMENTDRSYIYIEKLAECLQGINDCYNKDYLPGKSIKNKIINDTNIAIQFKSDCVEHFNEVIEDSVKKRKIIELLASVQQDIMEVLKEHDRPGGLDVQHNQWELYQKSLQYLKEILQTIGEQQRSVMLNQEVLQYLNKILEVEDIQSKSNMQIRGALQFLQKISAVEDKLSSLGNNQQDDVITPSNVEKTLNIKYDQYPLDAKNNSNKLQESKQLLENEYKEYIPKIKIAQLEAIVAAKYNNPELSTHDNKISLQDLQQIVRTEHEKYKWHEWFQETWPRNEQGIILHHNFEQTNKVARNSLQHDHLLATRNRLVNAYYLQSEEQEAQELEQHKESAQQELERARDRTSPDSEVRNILVDKGLLSKDEAPHLDDYIYQVIVSALTPPEMPEILEMDDRLRQEVNAAFNNIDIIFNNSRQLFEVVRNLYPGNPGKCFEELNKVTDQRIMSLIKVENSNQLPIVTIAIRDGLLTFNQIAKFSTPELDKLNEDNADILLSYAISTKDKNLLKLVIDKGINVKDDYEYDAGLLHHAISAKDKNLLELVIKKKINLKDGYDTTLLADVMSKKYYGAEGGLAGLGAGLRGVCDEDFIYKMLVNKDYDTLDILMGLGEVNLDLGIQEKQSLFRNVISNGHYNIAKCLIKSGINLESKLLGDAPLHIAVYERHCDAAKFLIESGADINTQNSDQETPLYIAVYRGYYDVVKLLIEAGADVNKQNNNKEAPLHMAAFGGHYDVAKLLIEAGADINAQNHNNIDTPLHLAVYKGHYDVAKLLIEAGADVNKQNNNKEAPLHLAVGEGHYDVAKLLIEAGADVNKQNNHTNTPLHFAVGVGHYNVAKLLIEAGADLNKQNHNADTPLHIAVYKGKHDIAKFLIESGADLNKQNNHTNTPLHFAVYKEHYLAAQLLIESMADINAQNNDLNTPLHLAVSKGHYLAAKILIEAGADMKLKNKQEYTPLKMALKQTKDKRMIEYLIAVQPKIEKSSNPLKLLYNKFLTSRGRGL